MSTVAGELEIEASVKNSQKTVKVKFKADFSTGQANGGRRRVQKVANGKDAFTLTATVKDQYGNLLPALWSSLICLGASNRLQTVISW